jgi:cephalosporin hydroxylase
MSNQGPYGQAIDSPDDFLANRNEQISAMAANELLHRKALDLQIDANEHNFGYQQLWCGVPIIRLPDDIVLIQEIIFDLNPSCIVETGVARAGSLLLNASLMQIAGLTPAVLGIDIQILQHALDAIELSRFAASIETLQADSTSQEAVRAVRNFVIKHRNGNPVLLVLDSNHSHQHVLKELQRLTPHLPSQSVVIVADTIVESMPDHLYQSRPWGKGNNPLTALKEFMATSGEWEPALKWNRRGLLSEFRDGVIQRR